MPKKFIFLFLFPFVSAWGAPQWRQFSFEYVQNLEPYEVFSCSHQKSSVGFFEWDVECQVDGSLKKFWVHLAPRKFGKTKFGENAYEVLYWVTAPDSQDQRHSSSSLWIHNSEESNKINRLVSSLGIEEDKAYLRLTLDF